MFFIGGHIHPLPTKYVKSCTPYDKLVIRHRVICSYHGVIATLMAVYWYTFQLDPTCSKRISDFELAMLANTAAHFVWDMAFMKYHGFLNLNDVSHHVMCLLCYYFTCFYGTNHNLLALNILPAELTNVSMHLREIYKRVGWRFTWAYYLNEYQYCTSYIFCRALWIPAVYYWINSCDTINVAVMVIYPLHCLQSWYIVSLLPKVVMMRGRELVQLRKAGVQL